jgi:hypothetical protein
MDKDGHVLYYDVLDNRPNHIYLYVDAVRSDIAALHKLTDWTGKTDKVTRSGNYVTISNGETYVMFKLEFG